MNNSEYFSELNFPVLKRLAQEWVDEYPIIDKLLLFEARTKHKEFFKYGLVAIVPHINNLENAPEEFFKAVVNYYQMPLEEFSFCEIRTIMGRILHFINNTWENCLHIREDLADVYYPPLNEADFKYVDEWRWYNEESIDGAKSLLSEFVMSESSCVLYGTEVAEQKSDAPIAVMPVTEESRRYPLQPPAPGERPLVGWEEIARATPWSVNTVKKKRFREELKRADILRYKGKTPFIYPSDLKPFVIKRAKKKDKL